MTLEALSDAVAAAEAAAERQADAHAVRKARSCRVFTCRGALGHRPPVTGGLPDMTLEALAVAIAAAQRQAAARAESVLGLAMGC